MLLNYNVLVWSLWRPNAVHIVFCFFLQGFAIGNGLTQPDIQYAAYADYALDMNLISVSDHAQLSKLYPACAASIKLCGTAAPE
jgi:hypothetical protein